MSVINMGTSVVFAISVCNVRQTHNDSKVNNQHYFLCSFAGQCGSPHRADRGALQPATLSADDVRVVV